MGDVDPELLVTLAAHAGAILLGAMTLAWRVGRTETGLALRLDGLSRQLDGLARANERLAVIESTMSHLSAEREDIQRRLHKLEGDIVALAARAGVSVRAPASVAA